jgi:hypothetical protein
MQPRNEKFFTLFRQPPAPARRDRTGQGARLDGPIVGKHLGVRVDVGPAMASVYDLPYPGIRLVTCGGRFNQATGHYVDNIVAYGHLIRTNP